jgi:hypothetical protein
MKTVYITYSQYSPWSLHDMMADLVEYLRHNQYEVQSQIGGHLYIKSFDYNLPDCEVVIYDDELDSLKAISFSEVKTPLFNIFQKRNNKNDILTVLHQRSWSLHNFNKDNFNFKLKNTTTYTFKSYDGFDYIYNKRQLSKYDELIDKMFFRTATGRGDELELSKRNLINPLFEPLPYKEYMELAIQYKVGLSIGAGYEICHRDIEYMAIGLPMLRLEYTNIYNPQLIPNYHYISIDREDFIFDSNMDKIGGEKYIEAYTKKFNEVKDNYEFLNFISSNANQYYKNYCSPENRLKTILSQLELQ